MYQFNADPRDGVPQGSVCDACCCEPISLMPGQRDLISISYGLWTGPIGWPGIMPGTEFNIEVNSDACPSGEVDGFLPPSASNLELTTAAGTLLMIDLTAGVTPAGNTFAYSIVPFSGPTKGTLVRTAEGMYNYTPNGGVTGKDYFSFQVTDAQGRIVIRHVEVDIDPANVQPRDLSRLSLVPFVEASAVEVRQPSQMIRIPIYMPLSCQPCERYKLTIKQPAQDCNCITFSHFMCFDITCKPCG